MTLEERIRLENAILVQDGLSQFQIYRYKDSAGYYLWGDQKTSSGREYTLWSPLPGNYPYGRPEIFIYRPNPLWGFGSQKTINSYGVSHAMHTLANGSNGSVQICHWRSDRWHSGITLNKVMLKAIIWLEAFEQHLITGKPISDFVSTMAQA